MNVKYVWDLSIRLFHWSLVTAFTLNAFVIDQESDLHQYIGYFVMVLLTYRIVWGVIGSEFARFKSFPISIRNTTEQLSEIVSKCHHIHVGHTPLGALMIYNMLLSLTVITLSGFLMTTDQFWGVEWPGEVHELFVTWVEMSIVAHIAAVFFESLRTKVNLPRAMITGSKHIPK